MSATLVQYVNLGRSGLRVSNIGLGTSVTFGNQIADETAADILTLAYDSGINYFDTSEIYAGGKAEIVLGKILRSKSWPRSSYIVATKIFAGSRNRSEQSEWRMATSNSRHLTSASPLVSPSPTLNQLAFGITHTIGPLLLATPHSPASCSSAVVPLRSRRTGASGEVSLRERCRRAETECGLSRKHIIEGLLGSLKRLQLDYVDMVFAGKPEPGTPMEEIVRAFTFCIEKGWSFYWGTSRWSNIEIMEAYAVARQFNLIPPMVEQTEYNCFQRERIEMHLPELNKKLGKWKGAEWKAVLMTGGCIGVGFIGWGPFAGGVLTGKYDGGVPPNSRASLVGCGWMSERLATDEGRRQLTVTRELRSVAERMGCSLAQLALAWCLKNTQVHCVLLGASSVEQLGEALRAPSLLAALTPPVLHDVERILGNRPFPSSRAALL